MAAAVGHVEEGLVGGETEAVGKQQAGVDDRVGPCGTDEVDLARRPAVEARLGGVDPAGGRGDEVVAPPSFRQHRRLTLSIPGEDGFVGNAGGHEAPIGGEALTVATMGVFEPGLRLPVGRQSPRLPLADIVVKHLPIGVDRGAFRETVTLADEHPILAGNEDLLELRASRPAPHRRRPALPQPFHPSGEYLRGMVVAVAPFSPHVVHLIAGEDERSFEGLIGDPPVAAVDVEILGTILEEDADRLRLDLPHEGGVFVATAQPDVRADATEHPGEGVGAFPGGREGGDRPARGATDGAVVARLREDDRSTIGGFPRLHIGEELIEEEAGVGVPQAVVFVTAVEAVEGAVAAGRHPAVHDEHADRHRHPLLMDEPIEDLRCVELDAVLIDVDAGRSPAVVLRRDIHPVVTDRPRKHPAPLEAELEHFSLGGLLGTVYPG